jgi:hypothetical protein
LNSDSASTTWQRLHGFSMRGATPGTAIGPNSKHSGLDADGEAW